MVRGRVARGMRFLLWLGSAAVLPLAVAAQVVKEDRDFLDALSFAKPETWVTSQAVSVDEFRAGASRAETEALAPVLGDWDRFLTDRGGRWIMLFDRVTGRPAHMEGRGIPWIPGTANALRGDDLGLPAFVEGREVPVTVVAGRALSFLASYPDLFGVNPEDLVLVEEGSGPVLNYLFFLNFKWTYHGIPVDQAHLVFRLNHGNLVQVGQEFVNPEAIREVDPSPSITAETAWEILYGFIGGPSAGDEILEPGRLVVVPTSMPETLSGMRVVAGKGIEYRLALEIAFRRSSSTGTWRARVDAHSGEILEFADANRYGSIHGGTYPGDRPVPESDRSFPYADTGLASPNNYADAAGIFSGLSATSTLNGKYVRIQDKCGSISLSTTTGDVDFGSSTGTNCTTPGVGGLGNTHAARTQYYNVTLVKIKALTYLPSNSWLQGQLLDKTNLTSADSSYCPGNAWWDGTNVNFCVGDSSYGNTGELPGVSLHEWAHGLDSNDGSPAGDKGTGETYGDFSGVLQTHGSCVGNGFFLSGANCSGYGDACISCAGIRQIDWNMHSSHSPHFPEDLTSNTCTGCTTYACSSSMTYPGPCGREGHCESLVSSEAMWDLPVRDLTAWGLDSVTSWQLMDRLWYASRTTSGKAYDCPSVTTANGCSTSNYFTTFRVVDDCDGDLSNGTPHASAIFNAFNRHKIACSTVVNTDQTNCCSTLTAPVLTGSTGSGQALLSWGAVTNATKYNVYRNESGCDAGYTKVGTVTAPSTSFTDTPLANGVTYYYRVQAVGASDACVSPMSNCVTLTPAACSPPGAPSITGIADESGCAQSGIRVSYTAGSGATSHNLLRDGSPVVTGYSSGGLYNPGDSASHSYVVQAVVSTCTTDSNPQSYSDSNGTPESPSAPTVTDPDPCVLTGVDVTWGSVSGATTYDLLIDGTTTISGVSSPYVYEPGDSGSHTYAVRAGTASCTGSWSTPTSGTDVNGLLAPAAPLVGDVSACASSGVQVTWHTVAGATAYDLLVDGTTTISGVTSPYIHIPGDSTSHTYAARGRSASCTGPWSGATAGADANGTPGAPAGLSATATAYNNVDLSWGPVGGASGYHVYRATGTCPQATYTKLTTGGPVAATAYSDGTASGSTTYAYVVSAVSGVCESSASACAEATTPAAPCINPPAFVGLASVAAVSGATCSLQLTWSAAASSCGGGVTYNVYRDTASGFTPGSGNLLESGLTGTTWTDASVQSGTTYYYVVRSVETLNGMEDTNTAEHGAAPGTPTTVTLLRNGIDNGWSSTQVSGTSGAWNLTTAGTYPTASPHGGTWMARFNSYTAGSGNATRLYQSRTVALPTSASTATWTFWMYHDTGYTGYDDTLQPQVSLDGNAWNNVGTLQHRYDGTTGWALVTIDLSSYIGQTVYLGILATSDYGNNMYVDDVTLTTNEGTLYSDGFEVHWYMQQVSGTAGTWYVAGSTTDPTASAHAGIALAYFNSFTCTAGNATRLFWAPGGTFQGFAIPAGATSATLSFWMYHDTGDSGRNDTIQAQVSGDGSAWTNVGAAVGRYNGTTGWAQASVDVTAYAGQTIGVGLLATSQRGNNILIDDVELTAVTGGTCTSCAAPTSVGSVTATDASACATDGIAVSWPADPGAWGDVSGTRAYDVLRDGSVLQPDVAYGTTSLTDATALPGVSYTYSVRYKNACGMESETGGDAATDENGTPTPLIGGGSANVCPASTVTLSTEAGMSGYQWYLDGAPVGTDSATHAASSSGVYTVSYTSASGCAGTSAGHTVTISSCMAAEVSGNADHRLKAYKNGSATDVVFEDVSAGHYQVYVSNSPITSAFQVADAAYGKRDCAWAGWTADAEPGMLRMSSVNLESGITGSTEVLYFLVTADNGFGTEGSLGNDSSGTARTADAYCDK
jgi:hypothetical protein